MTGTTQSSSKLDRRRARIKFRAWHRGTKEMDLVFGHFVDNFLHDLDDSDLDELEFIMSHEDTDLSKWIMREVPTPDELNTPLFRRVIDYKPNY
ncbi:MULTISPECIES: succinate dehydrogenase assembly factor 2 [unclassified Lentilitoribacter]|jgi:antitoxin CptB|uniref:FAD assembly factor SdhE n=1 Tax=unclassified Lentilitoribacter TaxID=2647570 RepID=UPI0013A68D15|nr:succinate dehydrogenase assembly factor 2 [Lentilitoribacter sp. Alg239-R112]